MAKGHAQGCTPSKRKLPSYQPPNEHMEKTINSLSYDRAMHTHSVVKNKNLTDKGDKSKASNK